ncbi:Adenylate cyclase [Streptomyces misionensis JCM 4497]
MGGTRAPAPSTPAVCRSPLPFGPGNRPPVPVGRSPGGVPNHWIYRTPGTARRAPEKES